MPAFVTVQSNWNYTAERWIGDGLPFKAHQEAALLAAEAAASRINAKRGTGTLEGDVRTPKHIGMMAALIGSSLPYARLQQEGGIVRPKNYPRLYIEASRGNIYATATSVKIPAKRYLDAAPAVYVTAFTGIYKSGFNQKRGFLQRLVGL